LSDSASAGQLCKGRTTMTAGKRVVILGGGTLLMPGILEFMIRHQREDFSGHTLVLMDIHREHLEIIGRVCEKMVRQADFPLAIETTTSRDEALEGADFVYTRYAIGGHELLAFESKIPVKYGMYSDDTFGAGGMFLALRSAPEMERLAKRMEKLCPQAWLINFNNPTDITADVIRRTSEIKVISLCSGWCNIHHDLGLILGVKPQDITSLNAGVNHCTWSLDCRYMGQDAYPLLRERLPSIDRNRLPWYCQMALELFETFGYFPNTVGHMAPYYYHERMMERKLGEIKPGEGISREEALDADYFLAMKQFQQGYERKREEVYRYFLERAKQDGAEINWDDPVISHYGPDEPFGSHAMNVIAAFLNDRGTILHVNVPNKGAIANLPDDAIVEVPAIIDGQGFHRLAMGDLPKGVVGLIHSIILSHQLMTEAALTGDRALVLRAFMAHPSYHPFEKARQLLEEMFEVERDFLPRFRPKRQR